MPYLTITYFYNQLNNFNMDFGNHTTQIILAIIAAIVGAGIIFKIVNKKKTTKNSGSVHIKDSKVGGDVAGRDIKK